MDFFKDDKSENPAPIVHCDVKNCAYHSDSNHCTANKINVGPSHAISNADTICSTFKPRGK